MFELTPPLYMALVLSLGIVAQWLAWRLRLPAIVLLLAFGFALGFAAGPPEKYLDPGGDTPTLTAGHDSHGGGHGGGSVVLPMVSLAVGVILFEGGLSLKFSEVRRTGAVIARLVTVGLGVTWLGTTLLAHYLMGFSWSMATLLGALLTVSGPTVIMPLLRQVRPERRIGSVVKWEGIVNDPIGAVLAALVYEVVVQGAFTDAAGDSLLSLSKAILVGLLLGGIAAVILLQLLRRYLIPDYLQNPVILSLVILVFAASNALQHESGLISVTVMGIILANQSRVVVKHIVEFKENLRVLLISVLFIVLSSRVEFGLDDIQTIGWGGLTFLVAMILLVRPVAVAVATVGSDLTIQERLLLSWIHPRGIVAAAVASLLALGFEGTPLEEEAQLLVLTTFLVIVGTVTLYGLTLGPVARKLGLAGDEPQGILFAGATPLVREIALSLKNEGFQTLLVDTNPQNISAARMAGLPVCYASIGSSYVHEETDLADIGRLLAMTPNDEINSLASKEFAEHFGSANVYQLTPPPSSERHERVPAHLRGRSLFAPGVTFSDLQKRFSEGAQVKKTTLTEDFTYEKFREKYPFAMVLFTIPEKGLLNVVDAEQKIDPKAGRKLIALVEADATSESGVLS